MFQNRKIQTTVGSRDVEFGFDAGIFFVYFNLIVLVDNLLFRLESDAKLSTAAVN
jgi:hypothetical protein